MYETPGQPRPVTHLQSKLPLQLLMAALTVLLLGLLAFFAPQQMPVVMYKAALVTLGAVLGYWVDRAIFPYARPHTPCSSRDHWGKSIATLRRALIVLACIVGLTLGL